MKQFFFSLRASYLLFGLLALAFAAGNRLAAVNGFNTVFREMTATHITRCAGPILEAPLLLAWLSVFIAAGAGLFINIVCCTTIQIRQVARSRKRAERGRRGKNRRQRRRILQTALIHVAAALVILLHMLDITFVERHRPIRLYPGQSVQMGAYNIRVREISYVTDPSMITEDAAGKRTKSFHIPGRAFSLESNFVRVEIQKDNGIPLLRDLKMLSPARIGAAFFFLDGFFIEHGSQKTGALIHYNFNPLAPVFFLVYIILFGLLVVRYLTIRMEEGS